MVPRARILCIPSFRLSCKGEKLQCSEDTRGFCSRHEHWTRDYRRDEISHAMMPHGHHLCLISSAVWRIFGTEPHVLSFFLSNAHEYSWLISGSLSEMALSFSCDWSFRFSSIPNHVKEIPTLPDCLRTEITIYWIHISFIYFYQEYSKDILYSRCSLQLQWLTESWIPTPCQALDQMSWTQVLSDTGDSFLSSQHPFSIKSLNVVQKHHSANKINR